MKILLLGPYRENVIQFLMSFGDKVIHTEQKLDSNADIVQNVDFIISYGYRYILKKEIIDLASKGVINLHISLLPWNKGADPNLWSFLENTPKGVTIHSVNEGLDAGDILVQQEVSCVLDDTLQTSYDRLIKVMDELFFQTWPQMRQGTVKAIPQLGKGTFHNVKDKEKYQHLLLKGWDTPIVNLVGKALKSEVDLFDKNKY